MNGYWTNTPHDQANASEIVSEMERAWRNIRGFAGAKPNYVVLTATIPEPRKVIRWRGRKHVVSAHRVATRDWFRARGVVVDGR